jgi:hypothetical protein
VGHADHLQRRRDGRQGDLENAVSVANVLLLTGATMTEFEEKSESRRPGDVPM